MPSTQAHPIGVPRIRLGIRSRAVMTTCERANGSTCAVCNANHVVAQSGYFLPGWRVSFVS
jgi:hypothetical protein